MSERSRIRRDKPASNSFSFVSVKIHVPKIPNYTGSKKPSLKLTNIINQNEERKVYKCIVDKESNPYLLVWTET